MKDYGTDGIKEWVKKLYEKVKNFRLIKCFKEKKK